MDARQNHNLQSLYCALGVLRGSNQTAEDAKVHEEFMDARQNYNLQALYCAIASLQLPALWSAGRHLGLILS